MEETILAALLADAGVAALAGDRAHFGLRPQGSTVPALVLTVVSGERGYQMTAASGLVEGRLQVDCYAATYGEAKRLARAVITAVSGRSFDGIQSVFVDAERDLPDVTASAALQRTSLDLTVWHEDP